MPLAWAINTAATASYKAVPSMFTVAPSGRTKRLIRASTLLCTSRQRIVVGRVAELRKIKMALKYFIITQFLLHKVFFKNLLCKLMKTTELLLSFFRRLTPVQLPSQPLTPGGKE